MADQVKLCDVRSSINLGLEESLEVMVKKRLKWSRYKWIENHEDNSRIHKLTNSIKYWSIKLAKAHSDKNVIIGLFNKDKDVVISMLSIIDELDKMGIADKLTGCTPFRNPRYLCFSFDTIETKTFVETNLKIIGESEVVYLNWADNANDTTVKVHWIPMEFSVNNIIEFVSRYATVNNFIREEHNLMSGRIVKNGTIAFNVTLKPLVNVDSIPHLTEIDGLEFLVNITGRKIMCLTCGLLGHKSSECPTPFCGVCRKLSEKKHVCLEPNNNKASYAQVANPSRESELEEAAREGKTVLISSSESEDKAENRDKLTKKVNIRDFDEVKIKPLLGEALASGKESEASFNTLSKRWSQYEISESEASDEDKSDGDGKTVQTMRDYFDELQQLRKDPLLLRAEVETTIAKAFEGEGQSLDVQSMDIERCPLKRKIESAKVDTRGSGRSYGRRGRGGSSWNNNIKTENLFQVLKDQQSEQKENG